MGKRIGIHLGERYAYAAIGGKEQLRTRLVRNRAGKSRTPAMVGMSGDAELLVGDEALENWEKLPYDTVVSIRRLIGLKPDDPEINRLSKSVSYKLALSSEEDEVRVVMGGKEFSPVYITAEILKQVKAGAEYQLEADVNEAVITCPARFNKAQRQATRQAALKAGLKVIKLLEEPLASATAYKMKYGDHLSSANILVYDIGGGSFFTSVVKMEGDRFTALSHKVDPQFEGDCFEDIILKATLGRINDEHGIDPTGDSVAMVKLRKGAQEVLEQLCSTYAVDFIVDGLTKNADGEPIDVDIEFDYDDYEREFEPLIKRSMELVDSALKEAALKAQDINYVVLSGSLAKMPLILSQMEETFGSEKILSSIYPRYCTAFGASILAGDTVGMFCPECDSNNALDAEVCESCGFSFSDEPGGEVPAAGTGSRKLDITVPIDVAPFHYGARDECGDIFIFIERGTVYPIAEPITHTFRTGKDRKQYIYITLFGGDDLEHPENNEELGVVCAVLPPRLKPGSPVRFSLGLGMEGDLTFSAELENGEQLNPWLMRGEQDLKSIEVMEEAEALFEEKRKGLLPSAQMRLKSLRDAFYMSMEAHDFKRALELATKFNRQVGGGAGAEPPAPRAPEEPGPSEPEKPQPPETEEQSQSGGLTSGDLDISFDLPDED